MVWVIDFISQNVCLKNQHSPPKEQLGLCMELCNQVTSLETCRICTDHLVVLMTGHVSPQEKKTKQKNQKDPPLHSCDILVLLWWTESGSVPNLILNSKPQCTIKHRTFLWKQTEVECVCTFPEQCLVNSLFSQNCKCNVWTKGTAACHVPVNRN